MSRSPSLVFIGDVHIGANDPALPEFLGFLERLGHEAERIVLMGDLFDLWLGRRELELPHHRAVLDVLLELRHRGVVVRYVEGNRDYRIAACYVGSELDAASEAGLVERFGGRSIFAVHGDLANVDDRRYRRWRAFSRSPLVWRSFNLLPLGLRLRWAARLERRLRGTNLAHKRAFSERLVRAYAAPYLLEGHDLVVLGHFHVERDLPMHAAEPEGRVLVLPEWKGSRRHLEVLPDGRARFVDSA